MKTFEEAVASLEVHPAQRGTAHEALVLENTGDAYTCIAESPKATLLLEAITRKLFCRGDMHVTTEYLMAFGAACMGCGVAIGIQMEKE